MASRKSKRASIGPVTLCPARGLMYRSPAIVLAVLLGGACKQAPAATAGQDAGSTTIGGSGADAGVDAGIAGTYPAFALDVPQVVVPPPGPLGPVLKTPVVVPVFFANDDIADGGFVDKITQFVSTVGASSYWATAVGEYGVGALTATTPYMSTDTITGTIQDSDIQTWILNKLATDPTFPQPTANTIYAMHYPSDVTISLPSGRQTATSCTDFGGYHSDFQLTMFADGGTSADAGGDDADAGVVENPNGLLYASYAVIPRCSSFGPLMGIDAVTGAESHELVEASTDPYPDFAPAYAQVNNDHITWELVLGGGEVGDMCAQNVGAFTKFEGLPFTVQRIWSNKSVKEGRDPCQPELPGEVYFNSMPELKDTSTFGHGMNSVTFESVNVAIGSSTTIPLDLFSDGDTTDLGSGGAWSVEVEDLSQLEGGPAATDFRLAPLSGRNGTQLELTITPKQSSQYGADAFLVISTLGTYSNLWVGAVGQPTGG